MQSSNLDLWVRQHLLGLRLRSIRPRFRLVINGEFKALAPTLALEGGGFNIGYLYKYRFLIGKTIKNNPYIFVNFIVLLWYILYNNPIN